MAAVRPKIVDIACNNSMDVAANMRATAARIEAGEFGIVSGAALVLDTKSHQPVFAWGQLPTMNSLIGLLQTTIVQLVSETFK